MASSRRITELFSVPLLIAIALAVAIGITPAAAQQLQARAVVDLNGRAGPSTQNPILFVIPRDAVVTVLQCTDDYTWCNVALGAQTAWASAAFLEVVETNQPIPQAGPQIGPVFDFLLGIFGPQLGLPQLPPAPPEPQPLPEPGPSEICLYTDVNFGGDVLCVNMGASNTNLVAPWNNAVSSIRVGENASVEVCGDPVHAGWCKTYVDNVNLTGTRNNSISSYRTVTAEPPTPDPTQPTAGPVEAQATAKLNARAGPSTTNPILFVIPQTGSVEVLSCLADYSWCRLTYLGQTAWASAQYLRANESGLLISLTGAQLGIPVSEPPAPTPAPPAAPTPAANEVCFYLNADFAGDAFCEPSGRSNFSIAGQWNNAISSIRIGAASSVIVCGDPNLASWCQTYEDDVSLTSFRNNSMSSYRTLATNTTPPAARVCFFENAGYGSASFCIEPGQSYAVMPAGWDNRITSIEVEAGHSVQVCRDNNF
ncbi:MAG: SH3 domain-containing protein, partial [Alphaproteobacteria bacterium]